MNKRFAVFLDCLVFLLILFLFSWSYSFDEYSNYKYSKWGSEGFFTNEIDSDGSSVLAVAADNYAIPADVDNKRQLIKFLKQSNSSKSERARVGSSYIVKTMLYGYDATKHKDVSITEWSDLEFRIESVFVDWHHNHFSCTNSYYQGDGEGSNPYDDALYVKCRSEPAIVFRDDSGLAIYILQRRSGSPVGGYNIKNLPKVFDGDYDSVVVGGSFNVFIDDDCSNPVMIPKIGLPNPGFQVVANTPRYNAIRDNMIVSSGYGFFNPITTYKSIDKVCYYF